ncbi:MAG: 16S rRNA (adenine(1518)-N(6)/adenine(1519)-N(6))-dimethyltransferase [Firmicutes bacterium HGW-Firmicutes-12]|jgi:16S rRNA (adenine1518-N6/adenine1519-N6)-dimethyltransferase|nr:MAG: 16S rRNA (adenine(1518)-N(6)/adenine(1519)-N(6))-dimethyltransferase [Firmicutes bacterium HGW-Firmicutes-12]
MEQPSELKTMDVLKKHGFRFKKKWGQNFLFDKNFLRRMVKGANIKPGDSVVEIGPGAGTLTKALIEEGARVLAIEIDEALIPVLGDVLQGMDAVVVCGDVLKMNIDKLAQEYNLKIPYKIVANLPYYITTPILMNILENEYRFDLLVIMVQWEVAERLTAKPGTKEYGSISLAVNYYTESKILYKVPRHLFTPAPDVDSAVVCFTLRSEPPVEVRCKNFMFKIVKAGFNQRRKTLANSLLLVEPSMDKLKLIKILDEAGIDSQRRGETLSLHEYANLANIWQQHSGTDRLDTKG